MGEFTEESFGRRQGANIYVELILSYPEIMDERIRDIAHRAAQLAIDAYIPHADNLVPAKVAKAIVREVEDMTFERGKFSER